MLTTKPSTSPSTNSADPALSKPKFSLKSTHHTLATIPKNSYLVHATNCFGTWGAGVALAIHDLFPNADRVYTAHCDSFRPSNDAWPKKEGLVGGVCVVPPQREDHNATETSRKDKDSVDAIDGIWIGCLFTSYGYGRPTKRKACLDKKSDIWKQTEMALRAFRETVEAVENGKVDIVEEEGMKVLKIDGVADRLEEVETVGKGKKRKRDIEDANTNDGNTRDQKAEANDKGSIVEKNDGDMKAKGRKMDIYSPQFNSGKFRMSWEQTKRLVEEVFEGWEGNWYVLTPPK